MKRLCRLWLGHGPMLPDWVGYAAVGIMVAVACGGVVLAWLAFKFLVRVAMQ